MAVTAQQLNSLLNETNKARQAMYILLDYVDLVNKHGEDLPSEAASAGDKIKDHGQEIDKHIEELRYYINITLNKMPIDDAEIQTAVDKIVLYHGGVDQAMEWTERQKKSHEENSYWWRYWQAVYDKLKVQKTEQ
ncbi:MAG TPA: hypothetical protein VHT73_06830 [Thermodesulfobacteriota bacterium]|nr:hypothetical protein [Thermodesulfobacteriota bacterium]